MKRRTAFIAAMLVTGVLCQGTSRAISSMAGRTQTYLLRLRGYVGNAPSDARVLGSLTVGIDSKGLTLQLTDVQTLNGPVAEGMSVLRPFALHDPNLVFIGEPKLVGQVAEAPVGTYLTIYGYIVSEQRMLLVEVQPGVSG